MGLRNFKYCGDCIRAGIDCFPSLTIDEDKPVKESFCDKAYKKAFEDYKRKIYIEKQDRRIYMKDVTSR